MTRLIPSLNDTQLDAIESAAEVKLYCSIRDHCSENLDAYFSVSWIVKKENDEGRDGECDFVFCHPHFGFLTVEVKGGGVGFDANEGDWFSIDRFNKRHVIKDPIRQALRAKYSILTKLKEHPRWSRMGIRRINCGHAVFFPDISSTTPIIKPDLPGRLIGYRENLENLDAWLLDVFHYWQNESSHDSPLGRSGLELFRDVFARSFDVRPLISSTLADEEQERIRLTNEQARVLDFLRGRRRVAVSGGAGTGKTLLAVEKAKRLASEGFSTLLTCFNNQLATHLQAVCHGVENLEVLSFHQLCKRRVELADHASGRNLLAEAEATYPGKDRWTVLYPNALAFALEVLPERFDAIVCDEGQDFAGDFWFPLELMLTDYEASPLYIFFDNNQDIYRRAAEFPIKNEPFYLTQNCRNTDKIHEACYHFYHGGPVEPPHIEGREIELLLSDNLRGQAALIHRNIVSLIANEGVPAKDIAVLIADGRRKTMFYEALRHSTLPQNADWGEEINQQQGRVLLDTVARFKGLEAAIIVLWGVGTIDPESRNETLYVGMSRAKSMLYLCGQEDDCHRILLHR